MPDTDTFELSAQSIVDAAKSFADDGKVFPNGCSQMVKAAYIAGGIAIDANFTANDIINNCPAITGDPHPGDICGWTDSRHGHVVIFLGNDGDHHYVNCPGEGQATKYNKSMGRELKFRRPTA
jgi:hypothetical protein